MGAVAGRSVAALSPTQTLPRPAGNGVGPGEGLRVPPRLTMGPRWGRLPHGGAYAALGG